ncbi:YbaB/EbfC family nucleoid-associated protein [Amycolatopsis sp., V23-08]|uniref:YbaB/EbfC family nucleoid-associated protein n=1 Tax=Amycolatopsis heterodermiae TaxID=3110235 RepID=A0ABU5R158_9PSEU|nr:YbaB/EbfC family nucleoid-associated protein [Amycolatopsis sp., V23-08]MEA5359404.1 YbaB/EbfC family nucleoid-associated protein [Amycolatopsis sp., V23-08]
MSNPQLIEELRWQLKQIEERRAENQRLLSGTSPDRVVTVVAGPGGGVREVRLAPEAMRLDAAALGRAITTAIREATGAPQQPLRRRTAGEDDEPYDTVFDV